MSGKRSTSEWPPERVDTRVEIEHTISPSEQSDQSAPLVGGAISRADASSRRLFAFAAQCRKRSSHVSPLRGRLGRQGFSGAAPVGKAGEAGAAVASGPSRAVSPMAASKETR